MGIRNPKPFIRYFSVEGETEKWYLDWLEKQINANSNKEFSVNFESRVKQNPVRFVKGLSYVSDKAELIHICDYEGNTEEYIKRFKLALDRITEARKIVNDTKTRKNWCTYTLAYSNLSFELWLILHKEDYRGSFTECDLYWPKLQSVYGLTVQSFEKYKQFDNFKAQVLDKLTLPDVIKAIERAEKIEQANKRNYLPENHNGYEYYAKNPSLSIHVPIKALLTECGLL